MSGPVPRIPRFITVPASHLYGAAVARRNARFDRGKGVHRVDVPVICVGNVVAGGTGKTPMVIALAEMLLDAGRTPLIVSRGYGGDEVLEFSEQLPNVERAIDADRVRAIEASLRDGRDFDVALLDDGFQHRRLARDLDLALVDATRPALDGPLLPAGWLREAPSGLRRAGGVVVTRADAVDPDLAALIERHHGRPPIAWASHAWTSVEINDGEAVRREPTEWLNGRAIVTLLGIANPDAVRRQVQSAGATIAADVAVPDHAPHDAKTVRRLTAAIESGGAEAVLTTRKDWVKLRTVLDSGRLAVPVVVPELRIQFIDGLDALRSLVLGALD